MKPLSSRAGVLAVGFLGLRRGLPAAVIAAIGTLPGIRAHAQDYPARNVTVVVPFPAGGGADLFARLIGQQLATLFGKSFIVDNRSGASGNIGAGAVVRAAPDGLTLLYTTSGLAISPAVSAKVPFDAEKDLQAVSMTVSIPQVLAVHPSLPVRNVSQFIGLARAKPGAIAYGADIGSAGHFAMEMLASSTAVRAYRVPYKGVAPVVTALVSGEVQSAFLVIPLVKPHVANGRMRAIGISSSKRASIMPDIPTLQEQGVAAFEALQWHGYFVPARTPAAIMERLHTGIVQALKSDNVKDKATAEGSEVVGSSPKEFAVFFHQEAVKYRDVARRAGIKDIE